MTTTLDDDERGRRELASAVKRLRVAATSDPQRADELADALVELTASRLRAWDFVEAATDAPESVVQAGRLLTSRGAAGPYASLADAVRFFSATAQLAAVQAALGQADAAGRTLDGLDAWRPQVARLPLAGNLPDAVVVWTLVARARALLTSDVAAANAYGDAAAQRLYSMPSTPPYLAIATLLLVADGRWAAGRTESALAHHRLALDAHATALAGLEKQPRPGLVRVALAPVPALHEPYARRLAAIGDSSGGIAVRRAEVALFGSLGESSPTAVAGLAAALVAVGRVLEARRLDTPLGAAEVGEAPPGERVDWEPITPAQSLAVSDTADATARWQQAEQSAVFAGVAARAEAERSEALLQARAQDDAAREAERAAEREQEASAAEAVARAEREAAQQRESALAAERAEREESVARAAAEERRRQLAEAHRPDIDPQAAREAAAGLDPARRDVAAAGDDPVPLAAAHERLADALRPLAAISPDTYAAELAASLEALVGLRWRLGDGEGSRAAAREARALGG